MKSQAAKAKAPVIGPTEAFKVIPKHSRNGNQRELYTTIFARRKFAREVDCICCASGK